MTTVDDAVSIPVRFLAIHVYYTNLPLMTTVDDAVSIPAGFLAIHVYYTNLPLMTTVDDAVSITAGFLAQLLSSRVGLCNRHVYLRTLLV
jgi:general stress protein CsbA